MEIKLIGIPLVARDRSSACANFGKMEDLLEGSLRSKEKYGHINHKKEIYKFKFQNQHNLTSLPPGLSLYFLFLLFAVYLLSVIAEQLLQYCKNTGADSFLILYLAIHVTKGRPTVLS